MPSRRVLLLLTLLATMLSTLLSPQVSAQEPAAPPEPEGPAAEAPIEAPATDAVPGPGAGFHSMVPLRVLDSRTPNGGWNAPLVTGADRDLTITGVGGASGVPSGAAAVVANVTVTSGSVGSFLTVWPAGVTKPTSSNLNFAAGQTIPNLVVAKLSADGKIRVSNENGSAHVIVDVVGYYETSTGDGFTGLTPLRVLDSRTTNGGWNAPLTQGQTKPLQITGVGGGSGVPNGASAVVVNTTVTGGTKGSFVTVWPEGVARPAAASNLNFGPGQTIPNLVMAKLSPSGKINIYNELGSVHVIVDVVGYYDGSEGSGKLHAIVPNRILDSRNNTGGFNTPWTAGLSRSVAVNGVGAIPGEATGVIMNTTVTQGSLGSFLTVYPTGVPRPAAASNVNFGPGETIPNLVVVKTGTGGKVDISNELGSVHVIADAVGYFAPDPDPVDPTIPPDPKTIAPALDPFQPTDPIDDISFLYTGVNPTQTGVAPGTIDPTRAGILKGLVKKRGGAALPGVTVTVVGHPEYGQTKTRADGRWDLVVNAPAGSLTINFSKSAYLPSDRSATVLAGAFQALPDVVLIKVDAKVTTIAKNAPTMQAAQSTASTDADGTRTNTVLVPANTSAQFRMPNGTLQPATNLSIRATEYTVDTDGPAAMPGTLPPNTGYTYAVELSADEATAAGARSIEFDKVLYNYVDNFMDFQAGTPVPAGSYDSTKGAWVPELNGIVIDVISESANSADIDVTGDGVADAGTALTNLGITAAERTKLAELFTAPTSLWRVPITHFSPWDYNWPFGCASVCVSPKEDAGGAGGNGSPGIPDKPKSCPISGSVIHCQDQALGERLPIAGTPFNLVYESDRVLGRSDSRTVTIPLTSTNPPAGLKSVVVDVEVAGQTQRLVYPPTAGQTVDWTWDGKDAYGRVMNDLVQARVDVSYVYGAVYRRPAEFAESFAARPISSTVATSKNRSTSEITVADTYNFTMGQRDVRSRGLGGWTIDAHHQLNQTIHEEDMGTGERRRLPQQQGTIDTVPGTMNTYTKSVDLADGTIAFFDLAAHKIRKINDLGVITDLVGTGATCTDPNACGDGGPGLSATLNSGGAQDLAGGPDGSLYWVESVKPGYSVPTVIRKRNPAGIVSRVVGNGQECVTFSSAPAGCGDGLPALDVPLSLPEVEVAPDGTLWIADGDGTYNGTHSLLRRLDADGRIRTVYGTGQNSGPDGPDGPAADTPLSVYGFVIGRDGSIFFHDKLRIHQITPDGMVRKVTGSYGTCTRSPATGECGIGGPAIDADLSGIPYDGAAPLSVMRGLDVDDRGYVYLTVTRREQAYTPPREKQTIYRFKPGGIVERVAFGAYCQYIYNPNFDVSKCGDGGAATAAHYGHVLFEMAVTPDARVFVVYGGAGGRIRMVKPGGSTLDPSEIGIPTTDGNRLDAFDLASGRHLRTIDTYTGATLFTFGYDAAGRLTTITDVDGNITTIQRNGAGDFTGVLGPFGHQTTVTTNAAGFLASVTNPMGQVTLGYQAGGLLTTLTEPGPATHTFTYDPTGRLTKDTDPAGGSTTLARTVVPGGIEVTSTTAQGRVTAYAVNTSPLGITTRTRTDPNGAVTTSVTAADGSSQTTTMPDGTVIVGFSGPDPRWGMEAIRGISTTATTTGGRTSTSTSTRKVVLSDPEDLLSHATITDTTTINGLVSTDEYDAATRTTSVTSAGGKVSSRVFDAKSRIISNKAPDIDPVTVAYDAQGRQTTAAHGTRAVTFTYDAKSRLATETNPVGTVTTYVYDSADRVVSLTRAGQTWQFGYDVRGNRTSVTMPSGAVHQFAFDTRNLQTSYTAPGTASRTSAYSADGDPTSTVWPGGGAVATTYDGGGRQTGRAQPGGVAAFGWAGTTDRMASESGTTAAGTAQAAFGFDGGATTSTDWTGTATGSFDYAYDKNDWLTSLSLTTGADTVVVQLARDADGVLTSVGPFTFTRAGPAGALSNASDGTGSLTVGYNTFGEPGDRELQVLGTTKYRHQVTSRDANGRILTATETTPAGTDTYTNTYDAAGHLKTTQKNATPVVTYTYDANGNRTGGAGSAATFDNADRVTAVGGVLYGHDANGLLTSRGTDTFAYGLRGDLRSAHVGAQTIDYVSDGIGRRVSRTVAGATEQYLYGDPSNPFRLTASRGTDGVLSFYWYDDTGRLLSITRGANRFYVGTDHLGTPKVVTDSAGTVVLTRSYDAYGNRLTDSAPGFGLPIGFAGGLEDPTTALVRFGYRDYIPLAGQFASTDPLLFDGGMNLYAYVNGEPVNAIDQSGLTGICVGGGVVTGLGGGFEYCEDISPDGTSGRPVLNKRNTHSICIEGAAGLSAGGGAVWKDPASTSATLGWDMGITCGPVTIGFSGEAGWKVNECGKWDITAGAGFKVQFGPYSVGFPLPEPGAGHATLGIETSNSPNMSAKCGLGVKASARGCKKW